MTYDKAKFDAECAAFEKKYGKVKNLNPAPMPNWLQSED